jgi:hypothetical protein
MAKKHLQNKQTNFQNTLHPKEKTISNDSPGKNYLSITWPPLILLGLCSLIFLIARFKLLAIPMERDEGNFAYISHWLWKGRELYTDLPDSKFPGLYALYSLFTGLFGYNATGLHLGLLLCNVASAICFYFLLKNLYNHFIAGVATSCFLIMTVSLNILGFAAHATQLLTPFVLAAFLLFYQGIKSAATYKFFLAGLFIGIAFTIKQPSAVFGIMLAVLWWIHRLKWDKKENGKLPVMEWIMLGVGGFLPLVIIVLYFSIMGRFEEFYKWTIYQPFNLSNKFIIPWYDLFARLFPGVVNQFEIIWGLAIAGLFFIFISGFRKSSALFGVLMALLGFLSVFIGAAFYSHYFVLALPGVALLFACTLYWISLKTGRQGVLIGTLISAAFIFFCMKNRIDYYFNPNYAKIHFHSYEENMFPESEKIGRELGRRVKEGERIGIMGSEPEIFVAAKRESCSKYLMMYGLLIDPVTSPPMQQEYMKEIKECAPEYIVYSSTSGSWATGYERVQFVQQMIKWVRENYEVIGQAEARRDKPGIITWDDDRLKTQESQVKNKILVFKKKSL